MATQYPTVSAWALAQIRGHQDLTSVARAVLLAEAATADRDLNGSDAGYNGSTVESLHLITGYTERGVTTALRQLHNAELVETYTTARSAIPRWKVAQRLLPYMTD